MLNVREATSADVDLLKGMIDQMAAFERLPVTITRDDLLADGFGDDRKYRAFIAEWDGGPCGYALFHPCYSSFQGKGIFLEDLYVAPGHRGKNVAKTLLGRVAAAAIAQRCFGVALNVLGWNQRALDFFTHAGAEQSEDWRTLWITPPALDQIASLPA